VAEESARGALAGNAVEISRSRDVVYCPSCRSDRMYRVERRGILQKSLFPFFGLFPWQCKECGAKLMLRKRNRRRRKHTGV
jgi:DNA-directed RNA polymerase subunit RPC12/RpoP